MGPLAAGAVVLVPFPFSDLSQTKLRPALVVANAGQGDRILCQITSNPYADLQSLRLGGSDFAFGSLSRDSFLRPGKLFTAHRSLIVRAVGQIKTDKLREAKRSVIKLLR